MPDLRPILTATDFSQNADLAVRRAARLAAEQGAALELLTVLSRPRLERIKRLVFPGDAVVEARLLSDARERLQALADELAGAHGCEVHRVVRSGLAHQEILRRAEEIDASLLVIGAHGERGLPSDILGGTALKILCHAALPVLLVRRAATESYRMAILSTDFSAPCRGALRVAARLASRARIQILHALDFPYEMKMVGAGVPSDTIAQYHQSYAAEARSALSEYLRAEACGPSELITAHLVPGEPAQVILEQAIAQGADLILIGRSGQSLMASLLFRSVSAAVAEEAQADVLVLHGADSSGQLAAAGGSSAPGSADA